MPGITLKKIATTRTFKAFLGCILALAVVACLLGALLLALPGIISSDWARNQVTKQISQASGKSASLDTLSFSWGEGLRLQGLDVGTGDLADASFLASLKALHVDVDYWPLLRGELHLALELQGLRLRVPPGPTPEPPPPGPAFAANLARPVRHPPRGPRPTRPQRRRAPSCGHVRHGPAP